MLICSKGEVKIKDIKTFLAWEARYHSQGGKVSQVKFGRNNELVSNILS